MFIRNNRDWPGCQTCPGPGGNGSTKWIRSRAPPRACWLDSNRSNTEVPRGPAPTIATRKMPGLSTLSSLRPAGRPVGRPGGPGRGNPIGLHRGRELGPRDLVEAWLADALTPRLDGAHRQRIGRWAGAKLPPLVQWAPHSPAWTMGEILPRLDSERAPNSPLVQWAGAKLPRLYSGRHIRQGRASIPLACLGDPTGPGPSERSSASFAYQWRMMWRILSARRSQAPQVNARRALRPADNVTQVGDNGLRPEVMALAPNREGAGRPRQHA